MLPVFTSASLLKGLKGPGPHRDGGDSDSDAQVLEIAEAARRISQADESDAQ